MYIKNPIYIRSLCVQTNIYEKNFNSMTRFYGQDSHASRLSATSGL